MNSGNLPNGSNDEIKERIIYYLKCFEETRDENCRNQYLLHVEYWKGVLQKMKKQQNPSFLLK